MRKLIATTALLAVAGTAAADGTIHETIFDGLNGLASERNTAVSLATTADDFNTTGKNTITNIMATFLVTTAPQLADWEFDIYAGGATPGALIASGSGGTATDTGGTAFGLAVHSINFGGLNIALASDTGYWIGVRGVGQNAGERAFWGSANYGGTTNGSTAMLKSDFFGFPDWVSWTELLGLETDVAFKISGVPSPGALALLGIAGLAARRRRRA